MEGEIWWSFTRDPRDPQHAGLRASDRDRELVHQLLAQAYAEGRLDREELDERTGRVTTARTLGELPPLLAGLVPASPLVPVGRPGLLTPAQIEERALAKWRADRREAVIAFVVSSVVCWTIWAAVMFGDFAWPVFVMLGTGVHAVRTAAGREEAVARERQRLERRQAKQLRSRRPDGWWRA